MWAGMIKSQFTLKQLEAFAFVVDTGTFRAAAAALGTTQPNISSRIAALEHALGVTLLYRDAGSVRLTDKGRSLLAKTREVLWAGEVLIEEAGRRDLIEEKLRLGVTELVACTWLQDLLRRLKAAYPNVRVELQVDLSTRVGEQLHEGLLDLAIQSGPFSTQGPETIPLGTESYVWVASADAFATLGPKATLEHLFRSPILTHAKHTQAGRALHEAADAAGLDRAQIVHSSALSACVPMVCEGMGVALLPEALIRQEIKSGKLKLLQSDWLPAPLSFFARYRPDRAPRYVQHATQIAVDAAGAAQRAYHK